MTPIQTSCILKGQSLKNCDFASTLIPAKNGWHQKKNNLRHFWWVHFSPFEVNKKNGSKAAHLLRHKNPPMQLTCPHRVGGSQPCGVVVANVGDPGSVATGCNYGL